ncbi:MAG: DUF4833 domain-containing protein [Bacteroidia bacterium]
MRLIVSCFIVLCFIINSSFKVDDKIKSIIDRDSEVQKSPADTFPVPVRKNMIFYVQRNHNINTIVYDLNFNADSTLNEEEPVHAHWIRYADHGEDVELSYLQKHYAYGIHAKLIDREKKTYKISFAAYNKRDILLKRSTIDNKYHAYMSISGKLSLLTRVYIHIEGGTFWFPHVKYLDLKGKEISSNNSITERFVP